MIRAKDKLLLMGSLLTLFGAGAGSGYFLGRRQSLDSSPAPALAANLPASGATASPGEWWNRALDHLGKDLQLTEIQKKSVQPLLARTGDKLFLNRDRALFQIHLELLAFHEALGNEPGLLQPEQKLRLDALRNRLRQSIETQFQQFLKDSPLPAVTAFNSP